LNAGPLKLDQDDINQTTEEITGSPLTGQKQLRLWIPWRKDASGAFIIDPVTCEVEVHTAVPLLIDLVVVPPSAQATGPVLVQ